MDNCIVERFERYISVLCMCMSVCALFCAIIDLLLPFHGCHIICTYFYRYFVDTMNMFKGLTKYPLCIPSVLWQPDSRVENHRIASSTAVPVCHGLTDWQTDRQIRSSAKFTSWKQKVKYLMKSLKTARVAQNKLLCVTENFTRGFKINKRATHIRMNQTGGQTDRLSH